MHNGPDMEMNIELAVSCTFCGTSHRIRALFVDALYSNIAQTFEHAKKELASSVQMRKCCREKIKKKLGTWSRELEYLEPF